jgi:hypothetical protein
MRVDEKFNKRTANQVEVVAPVVQHGPKYDLGVRVTLYATHDSDKGQLGINMTAYEALEWAQKLTGAAIQQLKYEAERAEALRTRPAA